MGLKSVLTRVVAASLALALATVATVVCVAGAASTDVSLSMDCCPTMAQHCATVTDAQDCCRSSLPNFFAAVSNDSHQIPAPTFVVAPSLDRHSDSLIHVGATRPFDLTPYSSSEIPTYLLVSVFRV